MARSIRRKGRYISIGIGVAALITVTVLVVSLYQKNKSLEEAQTAYSEVKAVLDSNSRTAWVAITDIMTGDELIKDVNIEEQSMYSGITTDIFWDGEGRGIAAVNIPASVPIMSVMLIAETAGSDIREAEYSFISFSNNIKANDYVDIRIRYADGTDYVVLSKKQVISLSNGNLVADLWVSEEEIQLMNSAVVDASSKELGGGEIYAMRYVQPTIQEAAEVNYVPSVQTIDLIRRSPNIVAASSAYLSEELRQKKEQALALINAGTNALDSDGKIIDQTTSSDVTSQFYSKDSETYNNTRGEE